MFLGLLDRLGVSKRYHTAPVLQVYREYAREELLGGRCPVGLTKFSSCKPQQIRRMTDSQREICCCLYHTNVEHILACLQANKGKLQTGPAPPGKAGLEDTFTAASLVKASVCAAPNMQCYKGLCTNCGVQRLFVEPTPEHVDTHVDCLQYERVQTVMDDGQTKHKRKLNVISYTLTALCALLFAKLEEGFVWHHYLAQWQSRMFRQVKEHIGPDVLVLIIDFAENLDIRTNFSIMQYHCSHAQFSIFCAVSFFTHVHTGEVVQEAHAIWSDSHP